MNTTFKLGKVTIPVSEENKIEIEGLEVTVSDYNLMEGLKVAREIPSIVAELKAVLEDEYTPDFDNQAETNAMFGKPINLMDFLASQSGGPKSVPMFSKGLMGDASSQSTMPKSLKDLLDSQEGPVQGIKVGSLEDLLKMLSDKGTKH